MRGRAKDRYLSKKASIDRLCSFFFAVALRRFDTYRSIPNGLHEVFGEIRKAEKDL